MKPGKYLQVILYAMLGGSLLSLGCGENVTRSIKLGLYSWISGGLTNTLTSGQMNQFLNALLTGGTSTPPPSSAAPVPAL